MILGVIKGSSGRTKHKMTKVILLELGFRKEGSQCFKLQAIYHIYFLLCYLHSKYNLGLLKFKKSKLTVEKTYGLSITIAERYPACINSHWYYTKCQRWTLCQEFHRISFQQLYQKKKLEKETNGLRLILGAEDRIRSIYSFNKYLLSTYYVSKRSKVSMWLGGRKAINKWSCKYIMCQMVIGAERKVNLLSQWEQQPQRGRWAMRQSFGGNHSNAFDKCRGLSSYVKWWTPQLRLDPEAVSERKGTQLRLLSCFPSKLRKRKCFGKLLKYLFLPHSTQWLRTPIRNSKNRRWFVILL